jgi:hypothetical protein
MTNKESAESALPYTQAEVIELSAWSRQEGWAPVPATVHRLLATIDQQRTTITQRDLTIHDLRAEVEIILRNGAAAERARIAHKMQVDYPLNKHAQEWAEWILRKTSGTSNEVP